MSDELGFSVGIFGNATSTEDAELAPLPMEMRRKIHTIDGIRMETDNQVRFLTGPVIGKVTSQEAVIMVEVVGTKDQKFVPIRCCLHNAVDNAPVAEKAKDCKAKRVTVFHFRELNANTSYKVVFHGVCKFHVNTKKTKFRTRSEIVNSFRFLVVSCDRPSRLLLGQSNPWIHMLKRSQGVDLVLHVGDQIYPDNEDIAHADDIFNDVFDELPHDKQRVMMLRGRTLWRNKYRGVFSAQGKAQLLAQVPNLMIWSDNDVANDFTTLKNANGQQKYHRKFLQCGMRTYREYQRRLWDPDCSLQLRPEMSEWHFHFFGSTIGVFMFDLRSNRVDGFGKQHSDRPLLSEAQWADFEAFLARPGLRVAVLCSETPFLGEEPSTAKANVTKKGFDFLRDHWPYNDSELIRLLDLCFNWKRVGGREVLLIGGDIHCGVSSAVADSESGLSIQHLTASPVTNHVCKFFPPLEGVISPRYAFTHVPLGKRFRNYADVTVNIVDESRVNVQANLIPVSTDIFAETNFDSSEDED